MSTGKKRVNRRQEILDAAEKLMLSKGLSGVTTREISKRVGCSDGALYVHFAGRLELLLAMLEASLPEMLGPLQALKEQVGRGSPRENLEAALGGIHRFHLRAAPLVAGLFAEPELLTAYRASLERRNEGPHLSLKVLEEYIAAERDLGRIGESVEPRTAAYLLMSASFLHAFTMQFFGGPAKPVWKTLARDVVGAVLR